MKKTLIILLTALFAVTLIVGCSGETNATEKKGYTGETYTVGETGPHGGTVFYDVDADNDSGNDDKLKSDDCGWKYLEVANANLDCNTQTKFYFCYYRDEDGVNKALGASDSAIGKGKENTEKIIDKFTDKDGRIAYNFATNSEGLNGSTFYAAYAATTLDSGSGNWFLPSKEEAQKMIEYLPDGEYWTSTESSDNPATNAYTVSKTSGAGTGTADKPKSSDHFIRPVTRF